MRLDYTSPESLAPVVEALIFASDEPLSLNELRSLILGEREEKVAPDAPLLAAPQEEKKTGPNVEASTIKDAIRNLNTKLAAENHPFHIIEIAGGFQFATRPLVAQYVSRLYKERSRRRLSGASLETLAIIAYKQPISKPDVEDIRGVNCDEVLKSLLEKNLITITGRADTVGRPLLYGTTEDFLRHFGLASMRDLPKPREIEEMLKDESIRATTLEEAANEFVEPGSDESITVDEIIAVSKEQVNAEEASLEPEVTEA